MVWQRRPVHARHVVVVGALDGVDPAVEADAWAVAVPWAVGSDRPVLAGEAARPPRSFHSHHSTTPLWQLHASLKGV